MKIFKKKDKRTRLEKEIDSVLEKLSTVNVDSKEYTVLSEHLERLYRAKSESKRQLISWDTIAVICGNLLGIILILKYEELNCISSKALGFVVRGRV